MRVGVCAGVFMCVCVCIVSMRGVVCTICFALLLEYSPQIHIQPSGSVELHGATRKVVKSYDVLRKLVASGDRRCIKAGSAPQASPKSHTVLTLHISITDKDLSDGNDSRSAKLHFVVLAGAVL